MANKIVGNVVGVPSPHTDFNQTDETKGDYLKNRDQIITVNDVLSSLSDDELYLEGHRTIPCADAVKMYVNGKLADVASGITDLGTYRIEFDPNIGDFIINELDDYNKALKDAKQTGIYKITLIEASIEQPSLLITLGSKDNQGRDLITQYLFRDYIAYSSYEYMDISLPRVRKYYYSTQINDYVWTDEDFSSESIFQTTNNIKRDETNFTTYDEMVYPSVAAVVRYVDKKLQPQAPVTTVPDVLKPNTEYNFGLQSTLNLSFPIDTEDGDVICIRFISTETPTNLVIDMSNVIDFELIPEKNTWYEICAKYDSQLMLWVLAYSEYMYMGG